VTQNARQLEKSSSRLSNGGRLATLRGRVGKLLAFRRANGAAELPVDGVDDGDVADARLLARLKAREPGAAHELFDRHADHVRRVLIRVLGASDPDRADLLQEVFVRALAGARNVRGDTALRPWLTSVTIFTAREAIRRRQRRRWLRFPGEPPEIEAPTASPDIKEAMHCVYRVLEQIPVDERIALTLRRLQGLELQELAVACRTSFATARRRLARGEARFRELARSYPALERWLQEEEDDGATRT
jgi:RNA polymerase sigma-70 factor (ECF subfamily)